MVPRVQGGNNAGGGDGERLVRSPAMPELPDLAILADAFEAALVGRPVVSIEVRQPLVVRGTPAEVAALVGQPLAEVTRRGKFLTLHLGPDRIVLNPMLTGRLGLAAPGAKTVPATAVTLRFGPRHGPASGGRPQTHPRAGWTRGAPW